MSLFYGGYRKTLDRYRSLKDTRGTSPRSRSETDNRGRSDGAARSMGWATSHRPVNPCTWPERGRGHSLSHDVDIDYPRSILNFTTFPIPLNIGAVRVTNPTGEPPSNRPCLLSSLLAAHPKSAEIKRSRVRGSCLASLPASSNASIYIVLNRDIVPMRVSPRRAETQRFAPLTGSADN